MRRVLLACGFAGPLLFTLGWLLEGAARPDYDPARHWVSQLSLGERGWIQIVVFVLSGALLVAFAAGLHQTVRTGPAARWGARCVAAVGVGLIAAGVFVTDPGLGYPPAVPDDRTWHGALHDLAGLVVFAALTAAPAVWSRRLQRVWGRVAATGVAGCWVLASLLAALDHAGAWTPAPAGLAQRASLLVGMAWLAGLALALLRAERPDVAVVH